MVCAATATTSASEGPAVDIGTRAKGAERVVVATVEDLQSTFEVNSYGDRLIVSHMHLQVEETMKGSPADAVMLTIEGGTVNGLTMRVSDMPTFQPGERAVFFLDGDARGEFRSHGRGLGILKLERDNRIRATSLSLGDIRSMVRAALASGGER